MILRYHPYKIEAMSDDLQRLLDYEASPEIPQPLIEKLKFQVQFEMLKVSQIQEEKMQNPSDHILTYSKGSGLKTSQ